MDEKSDYQCLTCGRRIRLDPGQAPENCCGQPMAQDLPLCQAPAGAEHAREDNWAEPCDDGRAGPR
jgi:hypothetical protein